MSKLRSRVRWLAAFVVAAIAYVVVLRAVPMAEAGIPGISPLVLVLNTTLLATLAGLVAGAFTAPRHHIRSARFVFFWIGLLVPVGRAVYDFLHGGMNHNYLAMLGGAFAGGMLGIFVMILPKPARAPSPRRFN